MPAAKDLTGMSDEERAKLALKRQKNKEAAQKCRAKKQSHIEALEKKVEEEMKTNEDLRRRIAQLESMLQVQQASAGKSGTRSSTKGSAPSVSAPPVRK
mmetsp:Transcript_3868/g.9765  ORF Transcript_3868/g.9765 Transcript_3868/m.9765 type:complete len:99 (-) Transcript_3868:121-417(-)|eukprot:CAMPEP_0182917114 /NCGR_PEP_ID=MMETSP0105_2-20130417/1332_1 /TAXON_ID=81532 ORGANISM="Acanthoeca-like sp., Strain 10tr" /NCGR_SAMPLE_ID=MMETSP0105_2 /ASSEMBLY_ACC=CAM_ASM_000205 /LENGTH=98 /DNA_ID=CAMNT_0025054103 /DNA_START=64 /DNA_END=360 /DNA_ORIENTATION=+